MWRYRGGRSPSRPLQAEDASDIVAIPSNAVIVRSANKVMPQTALLRDYLLHEPRKARGDGRRTLDPDGKGGRNEPDQDEPVRIAVAEAGAIEKVRDADLMDRQPSADRGSHILSGQQDHRAGRSVGGDGVHKNDVTRVFHVRKEGQTEGAAVQDERSLRRLPVAIQACDGGRSEAVVAAQQVAESQHEEGSRPIHDARLCGPGTDSRNT